jgi:hypothetical protein
VYAGGSTASSCWAGWGAVLAWGARECCHEDPDPAAANATSAAACRDVMAPVLGQADALAGKFGPFSH